MANISLPENERAARVQTFTLTSVVTAMVCAGSISIAAVVLALIGRATNGFRVVIHPRARQEPQANNGDLLAKLQQICHRLGTTWTQETIINNGLEPVFFDQFLRFQAVLFGLPAIFLTPTVASFNYRFGQQKGALDPLDRLGWSNLSASEAKLYWLYAAMVLIFAVFIQYMITRELKQTLTLQSHLRKDKSSNRCGTYYVAVQGLPESYQDERGVRNICGQWQTHVKHVALLPHLGRVYNLLDRRRRYVEAIERLEARFLARLIHRRAGSGSMVAVKKELIDRYGGLGSSWVLQWLSRCRNSMPYRFQSVASLYEGLMRVSQEHAAESLRARNRSAAILAVDNPHVAWLLSGSQTAMEHATTRMHYLGSSPTQIIVPNVARSPVHQKVCNEGITLCITMLVILWSIPMGASGFVSQLNAAFPLWGKNGLGIPAWVIGLMQGALPQLVTSALMLAMLGLLRTLTWWRCCMSWSDVQTSMQRSYFWFLFTQLFVTTSLSSGLIPTATKMLDRGLWELPRTLAQNLPLAGSYYLAYIPLQTALELASAVVHVPTLLQYCFRQSRWRPPRRLLDTTGSQSSGPHLGEAYSLSTAIAVIVIIYALFSPLILPVAALCAAISRVRFRYASTYVSKFSSQTNGELYLQSLFDLFWGVLVMEMGFIGSFILKVTRHSIGHDVTQVVLLALLLYGTWRYRKHILAIYETTAKGQAAFISESTAEQHQEAITPRKHDFMLGLANACDLPVSGCVVWVARDSEGISDALVAFVRSRFTNLCNGEELITNAHATLDAKGNVTINSGNSDEITR